MQPKLPPRRNPLGGPSYQPPSAPPVPVQASGAAPLNLGRSSGKMPAVERGLQTSNQYLRTPIVRYSSVMRVGKQHSMRISLTGANGESETVKPQSLSGGFDPPILVQVTIPGALVTPTHQIIPLSGGDANFLVQPITSGKLKGAKVEFLSQGRMISEIALPIKANKGSMAKWLLAIGILLPLIINFLPTFTFQEQSLEINNTATPPGLKPGQRSPKQEFHKSMSGEPKSGSNPVQQPLQKNEVEKTGSTPGKSPEKPGKKGPSQPAAVLKPIEPQKLALLSMLLALQPPTKDDSKLPAKGVSNASKSESSRKTSDGEKNVKSVDSTASGTKNQTLSDVVKPPAVSLRENNLNNQLITYRGEDAIWASIRHKLYRNGYSTALVNQSGNRPEQEEQVYQFLRVDRPYEITGGSTQDWSSSRIGAIGLYYLEPVLRLLYRVFIQFPRDIPLADLGFGLFFIALSILAWILTGPNRKKIKGAVMDIRLAN